jgi:peptidoglycan/LPS O-acetylase OafA/YrhL
MSQIATRASSIDLLRFIAAIMVATYHWGLEVGNTRFSPVYNFPIIGEMIKNGSFGVSIFFVISGFVIIGTAQKYDAKEFVFARVVRLFPGLMLSMLLVLIVGSHFIHPYERPIASFFHSVFLTYQVAGVDPLATQLWTLLIEIKFYFGVAIALLLFPKFFRSSTRLLILLVGWEITIKVMAEFSSSVGSYLLPYLTLNGYYKLFAIGICFKLLSTMKLKLKFDTLFLVSFYFIEKVFFVSNFPNILKLYLALASLAMIFSNRVLFPIKLQKISYLMGLSSYLIYLLHEHLGMAIVLHVQAHVTSNMLFIIPFSIILITFFSIILAIFAEIPMQKIIRAQFLKTT